MFTEYLKSEGVVLEEGRKSALNAYPQIGTPPENLDQIIADATSGTGKFGPTKYVRAMLPLGYANPEELMRFVNADATQMKVRDTFQKAVKKNIELYVPKDGTAESVADDNSIEKTSDKKADA